MKDLILVSSFVWPLVPLLPLTSFPCDHLGPTQHQHPRYFTCPSIELGWVSTFLLVLYGLSM